MSRKTTFKFSSSSTDFYFDSSFKQLKEITDPKATVLLTDENIYQAHGAKFKGWNTIIIKPGEAIKVQTTVDSVIEQLIELEADRKTTLVGIGGGVVTDITGYVASVYMRGLRFGFVPTSILALVDASIGGKNGIDVGVYKNMVGVIRQPSFLLHDISLLSTLPLSEWENGFAEVIKHAAIKDSGMFSDLEKNNLSLYQKKKGRLADLIKRNALIKTKVVKADEFEKAERRLLNFGHTLGHAIENELQLMHGHAVAVGMVAASQLSESITGFKQTNRMKQLLAQYGLPVEANFDKQKIFNVLKMDKKREREEMNYVLLEKIGKGIVKSVPLSRLEVFVKNLNF